MEGWKILKAGYITKSPPQEKINDTWRNRYFVLSSHAISKKKQFFLKYYKSERITRKGQLIKSFSLEGSQIHKLPNGIREYNCVLKLFLSSEYDNRELYLCLLNKEEMESWYDEISAAIKKVNEPIVDDERMSSHDPNSPLRKEIQRATSKIFTEDRLSGLTLEDQDNIYTEEEEKFFDQFSKDDGNLRDSGFSNGSNLSYYQDHSEQY